MKVNGYEIKAFVNLSGADLYGADLYGANLRGADLRGADLEGAKGILTFSGEQHLAICYKDRIQIGCKDYPIKHWITHYQTIGEQNGYTERQIILYGSFINTCDLIRNYKE
ncbi:MAG: hypothetical protein Unbinned200contig1002_31 [Prokaryotic dsDNA virus sp.]|nr:MAG: hypothetical protein Unbinned200contig1002_31 [Prokaryotic dsDNA virus sp.]